MQTPTLEIIESPDLFQSNSYLLSMAEACLVIDVGGSAAQVAKRIAAIKPAQLAVLATHGHLDHVMGITELARLSPLPFDFYIHADDRALASRLDQIGRLFGLSGLEPPPESRALSEGVFRFGPFTLDIIHTPGHSPGGVCIRCGEWLFSGDTLFAGSIGRTDLPGGHHGTLLHSIKEKLLPLAGSVREVYPGHGPMTTLEGEAASNPFLNE